jgi:hypothetical protein
LIIRISIPHNIFINSKAIGLDAYFWHSVSKPYRKTLFIRPRDKLRKTPETSSIILSPRIDHMGQISDLRNLVGYIRNERKRLRREYKPTGFSRLLPAPLSYSKELRSTLAELLYAEQIIKTILSLNMRSYTTGWLIIGFDTEKFKITISGKVDKVYQWLLEHDEAFNNEFINTIKKYGYSIPM